MTLMIHPVATNLQNYLRVGEAWISASLYCTDMHIKNTAVKVS